MFYVFYLLLRNKPKAVCILYHWATPLDSIFSKTLILWFCTWVCVQCVQVQAYMWNPEGNFWESIPFSHRGFQGLNSGCQAFVASTFTCWDISWVHSILDPFQNAFTSYIWTVWVNKVEKLLLNKECDCLVLLHWLSWLPPIYCS